MKELVPEVLIKTTRRWRLEEFSAEGANKKMRRRHLRKFCAEGA